jgi:hypothetical protein
MNPVRGAIWRADYPMTFLSVNASQRRKIACELVVVAYKKRKDGFRCCEQSKKLISAEVSGGIGRPLSATLAGAECSQIVVSVDSRAVTVVPPEFDSVVTNSADLL